MHTHRSAAADPRVPVPSRERALVVRVGYGAGEQVSEGRWSEAVEVPAPRPGRRERSAVLRPQERLAAILGGRDVALACEELTLRARLDADAGRWREAAFQLRVALEATIAELGPWAGQGDIAARITGLTELREAVGGAAQRRPRGRARRRVHRRGRVVAGPDRGGAARTNTGRARQLTGRRGR